MRVGFSVERDVVDPHVEVRPVDADEKHQAAQRCITAGPRQYEADADGDFHHARDEHPNSGVAKDRWYDGFEPGRVGEVLNADVDVHRPKHNTSNLNQSILEDHFYSCRLGVIGWSPLPDLNWGHPDVC